MKGKGRERMEEGGRGGNGGPSITRGGEERETNQYNLRNTIRNSGSKFKSEGGTKTVTGVVREEGVPGGVPDQSHPLPPATWLKNVSDEEVDMTIKTVGALRRGVGLALWEEGPVAEARLGADPHAHHEGVPGAWGI